MNVKVGWEEKVGADVDVDQIRGELEDGQVGGGRECNGSYLIQLSSPQHQL